MGKIVKGVLIVIGVVVVLCVAIIGYVAATFDPNQYKQQITEAVKESTHRTLKLEGKIHLSFFPNLALSVADASLSEPNADTTFLRAGSVRASVRLLPMLSKRVEVEKIELKGVDAHVVRSKDGRLNFADLLGAGAAKPQKPGEARKPAEKSAPTAPPEPSAAGPSIEIVGVEVDGASIDYLDEETGKRYALSNVTIKTDRIADGVPGKIEFESAVKIDQPPADLKVALKTGYLFEAQKRHVKFNGLDLAVQGNAAGVTDLNTAAKGDIEVEGAKSEVLASKLSLMASGKKPDGDFSLKLDVPKLVLTQAKINGEKISLEAAMRDAKQKVSARLTIPPFEGSHQSFAIGPLEAILDVEGSGRTVHAALASKVSGSVDTKHYELSDVALSIKTSDPSLPRSPIEAKLEGSAQLDAAKQVGSLQFVTQLDESRIEGKAGISHFAQPSYSFDLAVDQLDLDRYTAKSGAKKKGEGEEEAKSPSGAGEKSKEQPIDLSGLKGITANGSVRFGRLKVANISSSQVRADIKLANGRLDVNPVAANLYDGSLSGAFSAQSASAPTFSLKQQLTGINVGALLKDAANSDKLEGTGTFSLDVTTQGPSVSALKKGLHGNGALEVQDGSIKGIDLAGAIQDAKAKLRDLGGSKTLGENKSEKTSFTELKATFTIRNGVAHNSDLSLKSPLLRASGEGDIDIGNDRLDYVVKPTIVGSTKGQGGRDVGDLAGVTVPVRITGPLKDPRYTLDTKSLAEGIGKGFLDRAKESLKGEKGGGGKLQDRLKGLLGR